MGLLSLSLPGLMDSKLGGSWKGSESNSLCSARAQACETGLCLADQSVLQARTVQPACGQHRAWAHRHSWRGRAVANHVRCAVAQGKLVSPAHPQPQRERTWLLSPWSLRREHSVLHDLWGQQERRIIWGEGLYGILWALSVLNPWRLASDWNDTVTPCRDAQ
jgi:hypothetical protein